MARRLMSRRGGSASQPQVTPYQQIELDDGWREWENTKQELVQVKRQLTEKDAMIVQLKTASRRLQETLRKKDKDLQAAFAILRSPQNAKTTKTRKQELIDRLVSECMQRAATSEALAEERRQELDRMKYSGKFLRFQELEVEIEECHREIGRLRARLETTSTPSPTPIIAGKLKLSSVPLIANGSGTYMGTLLKKTKLDPLNLVGDKSPESRQMTSAPMDSSTIKMYSSQNAVGQVRVVPPAKYDHREGFVSKTRRRALEAEYYKQVRLAQLEVECELEENLHIRAAREAKRLEAIEHQVKQTELFVNSARSQQEALNVTLQNNESRKVSSTKGVEPSTGQGSPVQVDASTIDPALEQISRQQIDEPEVNNTTRQVTSQHEADRSADVSFENSVQTGYVKKITPEEPEVQTALTNKDDGEHCEASVEVFPKQKMYEDDDFDTSDDDTTDNSKGRDFGRVEQSVWNADPNPQSGHKPDKYESSDSELDQPISINNDDGSTKSATWNADPNPANSIESALPSESGTNTDRVVWNVNPHAVDSDASRDDTSVVDGDDEDDVHDAVLQKEYLVGNMWNLDPTPSVLTDRKDGHAEVSVVQRAEHAAESNDHNAVRTRNIWNLEPEPSSEPTHTTSITEVDDEHSVENVHPVWNLDPVPSSNPTHTTTSTTKVDDVENEHPVWSVDREPVVEAVSRPEPHSSNEGFRAEIAANTSEESVGFDPSNRVDPNAPDTISVTDPTTDKEIGASPWNLASNASPLHPVRNDDDIDYDIPTQKPNLPVQDVKEDGELIAGISAEVESNHDPTDNEVDTNTVWNLDPVSTTDPGRDDAGSNSPGDEKSVWNLDPHTGDTSEPSGFVTTSGSAHEDNVAATPVADDHQRSISEEAFIPQLDRGEIPDELDAPTFEDAGYEGDMAEMPERTSNQSSPRESEENMDDATPEYTPPSTARDSDAGYDDDTSNFN